MHNVLTETANIGQQERTETIFQINNLKTKNYIWQHT
jgi:hypothetical protein